jgi:hypothetical protein
VVFEFCSGLVDLVAGVGCHGGGGHLFARTGERFVGLVAEDTAQVGDRCAGVGVHRHSRARVWGSDRNRRKVAGGFTA